MVFTGPNSCPNSANTRLVFAKLRFSLPCSIFLITVRATPALSANSSWVNPNCFRRALTKSDNAFMLYAFACKHTKKHQAICHCIQKGENPPLYMRFDIISAWRLPLNPRKKPAPRGAGFRSRWFEPRLFVRHKSNE